jgi:hypothetical protein
VAALTEWELWACANQLVEQHGTGAVARVGERIRDLEAAGDVAGHSAWMLILERVIKLLQKKPGFGERVQ